MVEEELRGDGVEGPAGGEGIGEVLADGQRGVVGEGDDGLEDVGIGAALGGGDGGAAAGLVGRLEGLEEDGGVVLALGAEGVDELLERIGLVGAGQFEEFGDVGVHGGIILLLRRGSSSVASPDHPLSSQFLQPPRVEAQQLGQHAVGVLPQLRRC